MVKIVIPSASAENLIACVTSVLSQDKDISPDQIIVIDDGARHDAEGHLPKLTWLSGEKPFVFARNANLGLQVAESDVILLNDDATLSTAGGFTKLAREAHRHPGTGLCSPVIRGIVGNPHQLADNTRFWRNERSPIAFVCVYIPQTAIQHVGQLDERFVGYGFEDDDYCLRVLQKGFAIGIWGGCVINHTGALPSVYRSRTDFQQLFLQNQTLFNEKWSTIAGGHDMSKPSRALSGSSAVEWAITAARRVRRRLNR